ncbi:MAG: sigma-54-dependent Fis family transcriptional regulator [Desulfobacterales bacterium]|nr:sigma-54-dependent Fis family transcriptional regulator [Desulfobacterales bacterium]
MIDEKIFFREVTQRICGSLEIEKALFRCFDYMRRFMPVDRGTLGIFDEHLGALRVIARADEDGGNLSNIIVPLSKAARAEERRVSSQMEVMIFNDPAQSRVGKEWVEFFDSGDSAFLVMKLILDKGHVGTLSMEAIGGKTFLPEHARLVSMVRKPIAIAMANALQHQKVQELSRQLSKENTALYRQLMTLPEDEIVGMNSGLKQVFDMVGNVSSVDSPVLLLGETGVGKDVVANAVHMMSRRKEAPFIKINCGAIPENLMDSELFGHERGAFTGAHARRRGCFERAHHGTLFLDEIGELPPEAQVRMLRVLQHKEIERVGGKELIRVDVRILAATNRNLKKMVRDGLFREDLWFRLNVFPIKIPPLRERKEDIPGLIHQFIRAKSKDLKIYPVPDISKGAVEKLMTYAWPGNVRELENVIERSLILNRDGMLTFDDPLSSPLKEGVSPEQKNKEPLLTLDELACRHIKKALDRTNGRVEGPKGAARILGINPSTLRNRMVKLGIPFGLKTKTAK